MAFWFMGKKITKNNKKFKTNETTFSKRHKNTHYLIKKAIHDEIIIKNIKK